MVPETTKLENETREAIDQKLTAAGWAVQQKLFSQQLERDKDDVHGCTRTTDNYNSVY